jgi:hypothetical protein
MQDTQEYVARPVVFQRDRKEYSGVIRCRWGIKARKEEDDEI